MILHRFLQRRLQVEEPIINRSRVLAVERNHLSTGLAARDHFERLDFDASRDGVGNSRGWLTREAEIGSGAVSLHNRRDGTAGQRSAERRVGKECVRQCRSGWARYK